MVPDSYVNNHITNLPDFGEQLHPSTIQCPFFVWKSVCLTIVIHVLYMVIMDNDETFFN